MRQALYRGRLYRAAFVWLAGDTHGDLVRAHDHIAGVQRRLEPSMLWRVVKKPTQDLIAHFAASERAIRAAQGATGCDTALPENPDTALDPDRGCFK